MIRKLVQYPERLALAIVSIILLSLWLASTGIFAEADSVGHYQIARYAPWHVELFFDTWGKPLFTILASPMAQFGYWGAVMFNIACGVLTAWLAYGISKELEFKFPWLVIVFVVFTPDYIIILFTALTEILFSTILVLSIYLFSKKRFSLAALVISFIPLIRSEGIVYILLFAIVLVWVRAYRSLWPLVVGILLFSLAGWPVFHTPFWLIKANPYALTGHYGSGSFWYYLMRMPGAYGIPLLALLVLGFVFLGVDLVKKKPSLHEVKTITMYFLIIPSFLGYILLQSFLWWQGLMSVLASTRFLACVLPLGAILAAGGFSTILSRIDKSKFAVGVVVAAVLVMVASVPIVKRMLPMHDGPNYKVMRNCADWLKNSQYRNRRFLYSDPIFALFMDIDPFSPKQGMKLWGKQIFDSGDDKPGDILIWEPQFAGFESGIPIEPLIQKAGSKQRARFLPESNFTVIGGRDYEIIVLELKALDTTEAKSNTLAYFDWESGDGSMPAPVPDDLAGKAGNHCTKLTPSNPFSKSAEDLLSAIPVPGSVELSTSARVWLPPKANADDIKLVVTTETEDHKLINYNVTKGSDHPFAAGKWNVLARVDRVQTSNSSHDRFKIYLWYTGNDYALVDDLKVEYKQ